MEMQEEAESCVQTHLVHGWTQVCEKKIDEVNNCLKIILIAHLFYDHIDLMSDMTQEGAKECCIQEYIWKRKT